MSKKTAILFNNVSISLNDTIFFKNISLDIRYHDFIYLTGTNIQGKFLLLKAITAQTQVQNGQILVAGSSVHQLTKDKIPYFRRKLGLVSYDVPLSSSLSVAQNLQLVLKATDWKDENKQNLRIDKVLELLKINNIKTSMPQELSPKEYLQVLLARAILNQPPILLLDRITQKIDASAIPEILEFLHSYVRENELTVLFLTTQEQIPYQYKGDRVLVCNDNSIKTVEYS